MSPSADGSHMYVLDIDCYSDEETDLERLEGQLETYHNSAQGIFLDHITEDYKNVMRRRP